jgi:hypothetical protein
MPDLAQRVLGDIEFDGSKPMDFAHSTKAATDEIRSPRADERGAIEQPRDTLCGALATIALTAAIAFAVMLGFSVFRSTSSERATIEATDVNALVERIIKVESNGNPNAKNRLSSATGVGQFLTTHGLKPSEFIDAI